MIVPEQGVLSILVVLSFALVRNYPFQGESIHGTMKKNKVVQLPSSTNSRLGVYKAKDLKLKTNTPTDKQWKYCTT